VRRVAQRGALAAALVGSALVAGSCAYLPEAPQGLEGRQADDFIALPVRAWLLRDDVRPVTMAGCLVEPCSARVGVAVFDMTGNAARDIERAVAEPERVRADVMRRDREDRTANRAGAIAVQVERMTFDGARGFSIRLSKADGSRAAHGVALTRAQGERTRVVISVADEAPLALSAARQVASAHLR
jgi:hypothetical protein